MYSCGDFIVVWLDVLLSSQQLGTMKIKGAGVVLGLVLRQKPDVGQSRAVCPAISWFNPSTCYIIRCLQSLSDQVASGTALLFLLKAKLRGSLTDSSFLVMGSLVAVGKVSRNAVKV